MADTLTDQQITEACARAMNLNAVANPHEKGRVFYQHPSGAAVFCVYDPLHDRAQAMELVEKLKLGLSYGLDTGWVADGSAGHFFDPDILRAICLCAARVQLEKEKGRG